MNDDTQPRFKFASGGAFVLDLPTGVRPIWGAGDDVLIASGEAMILAGVQGTGKSTIAQQFALGRCGFDEYRDLFGLPIAPGNGRTLYLAMDRPRQIARSLRRMVGSAWRGELNDRLIVWPGPPPYDLAKFPTVLRDMAIEARADTIIVDSLKDAFLGLNDDEAAAGWNRARQAALVAGIELLELHHGRKASNGIKRDRLGIDDVYGSTWITSGAGSVVILSGQPGDPVVDLHHVKQPMNEIGPFKIIHDHENGQSSLYEATDLVALAKASGGITVATAAQALNEGAKPNAAMKEKARRRLQALERSGQLTTTTAANSAAGVAQIWQAK